MKRHPKIIVDVAVWDLRLLHHDWVRGSITLNVIDFSLPFVLGHGPVNPGWHPLSSVVQSHYMWSAISSSGFTESCHQYFMVTLHTARSISVVAAAPTCAEPSWTISFRFLIGYVTFISFHWPISLLCVNAFLSLPRVANIISLHHGYRLASYT